MWLFERQFAQISLAQKTGNASVRFTALLCDSWKRQSAKCHTRAFLESNTLPSESATNSRAVNAKQFSPDERQVESVHCCARQRDLSRFTPEKIHEIIYSVAIGFCCYVDLTKQRDQKTPGTFLEYLISHLFAWQLGVNPTTRIQVLNLDMDTELPTDFII